MSYFKMAERYSYYLGLFIYVLSYNIQYSYAHNEWVVSQSPMLMVIKIMRYIAYLLCALHLVSIYKHNLYSIVTALILFVAAVYATHTGPQRAPIFYTVILVTGIRTDFAKCVKIFLIIQLVTFATCLLLSFSGISGSDIIEYDGRMRSFLGYGWVNRASYALFFISLELLYLKKCRFNLLYTTILSAINLFVYSKTHTVFSMTMTFGVIAYGTIKHLSFKMKKKTVIINSRRSGYLVMALFIATIIIGLVLPIIYNADNPFMNRLNRIVTGRLELGKLAIEQYGLHIGGNKIQWVGSSTLLFGLNDGTEYFYVDNGFLQLGLEFGLLFTGFIIFIYLASIRKASIIGNQELIPVMIILGILFVFEPYTIDFAFNPFVLYFFSNIFKKTSDFADIAIERFQKRGDSLIAL